MKQLLVVFFLLPSIVSANTTTYECLYTSYSDIEGNHKLKDRFVLSFIVDDLAKKSYILGNNGSSQVEKLESKDQLSFFEITGTLNLMTTTIDSKLKSVHSRNTVIFGELTPSQYYGKCKIK